MTNRFHSKWHRHNHHTNPTTGEPDSSHDPIASSSDPFQGDFYLNGTLSATDAIVTNLSAVNAYVTNVFANTAYIDVLDITMRELSGFQVLDGDLTVQGSVSAQDIIYAGCGDSTEWCSTYTTVEASSANWNSTYTTVCANSATWEGDFCDKIVYLNEVSACNGTVSISGGVQTLNGGGIFIEPKWAGSSPAPIPGNNYGAKQGLINTNDTTDPEYPLWSGLSGNMIIRGGINGSDWWQIEGRRYEEDTGRMVFTLYDNATASPGDERFLFEQTQYINDSTYARVEVLELSNAGASLSANLNMNGYDISGVGNSSLSFENGTKISVLNNGLAIGINSQSLATNAYQLASGSNSTPYSLQFGDVMLISGGQLLTQNLDIDFSITDPLSVLYSPTNYSIATADVSGHLSGIDIALATAGGSDLTDIIAASGNWDTTYTTVCANSAIWGAASFDATDVIAASGNWDTTYTTVCANSANWGAAGFNATDVIAASGNWDSVYTTVDANSGNWNTAYSTVSAVTLTPADSVTIGYTPTNYSISTATLSGHLSGIDIALATAGGSDLTDVIAASGNWDTTYTTVCANSAIWSNHFNATDVIAASGNWNSVYTTVDANSASWAQSAPRSTIIVESGPVILTTTDSGTTYVVSAVNVGEIIFRLPAVTISNLGVNYTFCKFATGSWLSISGTNAMIDDSELNATIYSGSSANGLSAGEQAFASVELQLVLPDQWHTTRGRKVWSTTQFV